MLRDRPASVYECSVTFPPVMRRSEMSHFDCRGLELTASSDESIIGLDFAVDAYLSASRDTAQRVAVLVGQDPACVLGQCLQGYFLMHAGKSTSAKQAGTALAAAKAGGCATPREQLHLASLQCWIDADLSGALLRWRAILESYPRDILALRLAQFASSYLGDSRGTCECVARTLPAWNADLPGYGFVLGCYAYGLEESGEYGLAEQIGREAVERNSSDIWAGHAVAHVMEMDGRPHEGIAWIAELEPRWQGCNNFVFHLWWHQALFYLALGEFDRVLDVYDRKVRAESTDEYLDLVNAASLLWRLEQANVDVGSRWRELAERAVTHMQDHAFALADLHYAIAIAACEPARAESFLDSCAKCAQSGRGTVSEVMNAVGLAVAGAIVAHRRSAYDKAATLLLPVRSEFRRIGGSHAQRDIFDELLIDSAVRSGRLPLARLLLAERTAARPHDIWSWRTMAALCGADDGNRASRSAAHAKLDELLARASAVGPQN
jgi:tetratricopeptide (TPR) repeat protein